MSEGRVIAVRENLVRVALGGAGVRRNEIARIEVGGAQLRAEVLRIRGDQADLQLYDDSIGMKTGSLVRFSGDLLTATLGPGLLGQVYDGLQTPLRTLHERHGSFLARGAEAAPLDPDRRWDFEPMVDAGAPVFPGQALGQVREGLIMHPILAPIDLDGAWTVTWVAVAGRVDGRQPVARLSGQDGARRDVGLFVRWPVRRPMGPAQLALPGGQRGYPDRPLLTGIRLIDTLFPIARGGTACIPGPFGAGKTMLLNLIARFAEADVVVVVACGERAGEVTETIETFPELPDPRTGGRLIDRTVIICNTSAMPVSARETSIHLGATIGEYYRGLGLDVLLLADSTSRWAQALRETSGLMEELPGDDAYPAYLDSAIKGFYERGGLVSAAGRIGSLTIIGTVSPAGGNFEEPVTQATLSTVKAFLGLSAERAYRRAYPAIDPLLSWSRYRAQLSPWFAGRFGVGWTDRCQRLLDKIAAGDQIARLVAVAGEDGVAIEDFIVWQQAQLIDRCFLQQNALDPVDASTPLDRQNRLLLLIERIVSAQAPQGDKEAVRAYYARLASLIANLNLCPAESSEHAGYEAQILATLAHPESEDAIL